MPCKGPRRPGIVYFIAIIALAMLIFYQTLITLILPFRWHIFLLLLEISILFFLIFRIIWPY